MGRPKTTINPECGKRLSQLIVNRGKTQKEVAELINVTQQHLNAICKGRKRLTPDMADAIIRKVFPDIRLQWILCTDNFVTEADKEAASEKAWKENIETEKFYDDIFRIFIDGIEDLSGYGLEASATNSLTGDYIVVTDNNGKRIGAVLKEDFDALRNEIEHFASYQLNLLIKNKMIDIPIK